ncbi:MAG: 30S ribosomal protein S5 [Candidatus Paceibacterota bacterium]
MEENKQPQNNNHNDGQRDRRPRRPRFQKEKSEFDSKVLDIARVTRVTKGGKRFSFRATIVLGDGKGRVGVGVAQGHDVAQSMQKATNQAKKKMVTVPIKEATIPHEVSFKYGSAVVMLKPMPPGSGVKAGGPVRVVAKLAGIENVTAKLIKRTSNKINIARATIGALSKLKS